MSHVQLADPIAAFSEQIAQPFEDAGKIMHNLADIYDHNNSVLRAKQKELAPTFKGLGADAFVTYVDNQIKFIDGNIHVLNVQGGFYETAAKDVRWAARDIEYAIGPFLEICQWVVDHLTPDMVVSQGESAIHAVFSDMNKQLKREMHDTPKFIEQSTG